MTNNELAYIAARRDVTVVGGGLFEDEIIMHIGGEPISVASPDGEPRIILFVNAYVATGPDGRRDLFLVKSLEPMGYRKVTVGKEYRPKVTKKGLVRTAPAVESFPFLTHSTSLRKSDLADLLVRDGVFDEPPALRATLLLVAIGRGAIDQGDWSAEVCVTSLAKMSSGSSRSCTFNESGMMSVEIIREIPDIALVATESLIALDAWARRMRLLHGSDWESVAGQEHFSRSLMGNICYAVPPFLIRELGDEDPKSVARKVMPIMRLYGSLSDMGPNLGGREAVLSLRCNESRSRCLFVALSALADPGDGIVAKVNAWGACEVRGVGGEVLAKELGPVIDSEPEARRILSTAVRSISSQWRSSALLATSALLGSDWGRRIVTTRDAGVPLVAADLLLCSVLATDWGDDAWGDWVAGEICSVIGSVAYAEAVRELIPVVCDRLGLSDAWDVIDPCSLLDEHDMSPDWHMLAEGVREDRAKRERKRASLCGYGLDEEDCRKWDEFHSWEECLYASDHVGDTKNVMKADRFVDLCRLVRACRHALRHLDGMGWREVLSAFPVLARIVSEDGHALPIRNDVVVAAGEVLWCLSTEDGFDADGEVTGVLLPGIVMDDESIVHVHAERHLDGWVGRMSCVDGGDAIGDTYVMPADEGTFADVDHLISCVFEIAMAKEGDETLVDGDGDS